MKNKNQSSAICSNVPPNDLGLEQAVLGYLISGKDFEKISFLMEEMFYSDKHRIIFHEIIELLKDDGSVDIVRLKDNLKAKHKGKILPVYIVDLVGSFVSETITPRYATKIREKYYLRKMLTECQKTESDIYGGYDLVLVRENISSITELSEESSMLTDVGLEEKHKDYELKLNDTFARVEYMSKNPPEFPTGIYELDEMTGGLGRGDVLTIGGATSIGKTALAITISMNLLKMGKKVGIFSLEMGEEQLYMRMAQMETAINLSPAKIYGMQDDDLEEVKLAMEKLKKYDMMVWDNLDSNTAIMKLIESTKRDVIIIDYVQLIVATKEENRYREIGRIVRILKQTAKRLNIPVIILSQLKRGAESRDELYVSDCYESGGIEQNSDGVWLIDRPAVHRGKGELSDAKLYIGKNRHGPIGKLKLYYVVERLLFRGT